MPHDQTAPCSTARSEYARLQTRKEELKRELKAVTERLADLERFIERPPALQFDAHGLSISEATELLLRIQKKPFSSQELVEALSSGGLPNKAIGRVEGSLKLTVHRFKCLDGYWGLDEWTNERWAGKKGT
jgi:hypothetical protein